MSRAASGRTIGFHSEIHSEVSHLDREFKPTSLENDLCCNKPWRAWNGCATKFQRAGTFVRRPQAPVDVEDPEEEVRRLGG